MDTPPTIDRRALVHLSWRSPLVWLAFVITIGFFSVLFTMMLRTDANTDMMIGTLMAAFSGIVGFFFGSSVTTAGKDAAISDLTKTAAVVATTAQATQAASDAPRKVGDMQVSADTVTVATDPDSQATRKESP